MEAEQKKAKFEASHISEVRSLQGTISTYKAEIDHLKEGLKRYNALQQELRTSKHTAEETARELAALKTSFADQEKLLKTRSAELRQAQAYLSTVDALSHADILGMVERLNSNIFQLAASIADFFQYDKPALVPYQLADRVQRAEMVGGRGLITLLMSMRRNADSACVQMALQTALLNLAAYVTTSWDVRFNGDQNNMFTNIYLAIFQNGE